jgi:hypothetical protein
MTHSALSTNHYSLLTTHFPLNPMDSLITASSFSLLFLLFGLLAAAVS